MLMLTLRVVIAADNARPRPDLAPQFRTARQQPKPLIPQRNPKRQRGVPIDGGPCIPRVPLAQRVRYHMRGGKAVRVRGRDGARGISGVPVSA